MNYCYISKNLGPFDKTSTPAQIEGKICKTFINYLIT